MPRIAFVKDQLASRSEKPVYRFEKARRIAAVEKVHCNHIVKAPTRKRPREFGDRKELYCRLGFEGNAGAFLECDGGNRVFHAGNPQERACEESLSATELENRLPRQKMDRVAERLGPPQQTIFGNRIVLSPVIIAVSFPHSECRMKRSFLFHGIIA